MAITDTSSTVPIPSPPGNGRHAPATTAASVQAPVHAAAPAVPTAPAGAAAAPQAAPLLQPIGLTLSYDGATHRLVLEAREPGSGFLIAQIPPGYVVKRFTATIGGITPARGASVNSAA